MRSTRTETDSLGSRELPIDALYGVCTLRGRENFDISHQKLGDAPDLLKALARIKHAAAEANRDIGVLPPDIARAIIAAATEVEAGRHSKNFIIDLLEGSGGTSINMNVNEVIANRALQILGETPGTYDRVHPNDHVNLGQSTNDVLPTALRLALYDKTHGLLESLRHLADTLEDRSSVFAEVLRIGRTCMQSAQPMRLGQAFGGYATAIRRLIEKLVLARDEMLVLPLGGTAIGTGLGSAPGYRSSVYRHLRRIVGADVRPSDNLFDAMQNADSLARVSSEIRICADVIGKIASDLVVLSSCPDSGIGELHLPAVQPGSSIMPGKVNPVLPMMMQQVACAVAGNDMAVSLATRSGQLEINYFEPVVVSRLFDSIEVLAKSSRIFADRCIAAIEADEEQCFKNLMQSSALATVFVPKLGYAAVSRLVQASVSDRRAFVDLVVERGLATDGEVLALVRGSTDYCEDMA